MFSVVVPLYNKENSVLRAIASILGQNYVDFELIIVNDGSTDKSLFVVDNIKDERIRIIDKVNGGVSSARNVGIEVASSDWICFLDADDYWLPNHLEEICYLLNKYPEGKVFSTLISENSESGIKYIENSLPDNFEGYLDNYFYYARKGTIFHSSSVCVFKAALLESGCFDPNLKHGEDLDVWFKLMIKNKGVVKKTSTVVYDLLGENRAMHSKCEYKGHLLSKIDSYRSDQVIYLNEFIDFFILRNSIPYYFSDEKDQCVLSILKIKDRQKMNRLWSCIYSDLFYGINLAMYKLYKNIRSV
jgi:glycosyltransferase involved in cell wall biosynthesis